MRRKVFRYLLKILIIALIAGIIWILFPRTWAALNPDKPPVGYHFMLPAYIAIWSGLEELADLAPAIPDGIEEIRDIEYKNINGKSLQLDIYKPRTLKEPAPLLLFIHGGAWKGGKRSDYLVYLIHFAKKGYVTATVSYRLLSDSLYPACIEDITDALGWVFPNHEKYGYDPERVAVIGGSAGGHLATLAGYGWGNIHILKTDSFPGNLNYGVRAVVDIYGPVDLTTPYARSHPLVTALTGCTYDKSPALFEDASPVKYLDSDDPPTLILHGTSDRLVPISQSEELKVKLDSLGVPCILYKLPLWPHTMDVVERVNVFCRDRMEEFFNKYL